MSEYASSSSSDPPLPAKTREKKSKKDKEKQEGSSSVIITPHGRNEGTNADWAYTPPPGFSLVDHGGVDSNEFDWDAVKDDAEHLEMWIIRVPDGIKPKHLQGHTLDVPTSSNTARVGSLDRKHGSYDIWSLGEDGADPNISVGAEELQSLSCLLPRKKKGGKLYLAPKVPVRYLALTARPALPTPTTSPGGPDRGWATRQNPPRPAYPKEALKHRFIPMGALAPSQGDKDGDVRMGDEPSRPDTETGEEKQLRPESKEGEGSTKKRKAESKSSSGKKSRKVKVQ